MTEKTDYPVPEDEGYIGAHCIYMGLRWDKKTSKFYMLWLKATQYANLVDAMAPYDTIEYAASRFTWDKNIPPLIIGGTYSMVIKYDEARLTISNMKLKFARDTNVPLLRDSNARAWMASEAVEKNMSNASKQEAKLSSDNELTRVLGELNKTYRLMAPNQRQAFLTMVMYQIAK